VLSVIFIIVLVVAIFAIDIGGRWWRETAWKRRWKGRGGQDEGEDS
jgi:hypothetical protein